MRTIEVNEERYHAIEARHVLMWLESIGLLGPARNRATLAREWSVTRARLAQLFSRPAAWFRQPFVVVEGVRGRLPGERNTRQAAERVIRKRRIVRNLQQMGLLGPAHCPHCGRPWG